MFTFNKASKAAAAAPGFPELSSSAMTPGGGGGIPGGRPEGGSGRLGPGQGKRFAAHSKELRAVNLK